MKRLFIILGAVVILTSCGLMGSNKSDNSLVSSELTELNDWQKNLLEAEGLPTEIEELTISQQYSIQHIYEMITYLNEKYEEEFIYSGYVEKGINNSEKLYAYPKAKGAGADNIVTVKVDNNGEFTDDYHSISIHDYYKKIINEYISSYLGTDDYFYYSTVNACKIEMSEIVNDNFQWKYGASNIIFIKMDVFDIEKVEKFAVNYAKFLYEHQIDGAHRINVMRDWPKQEINRNNCSDWYNATEYIGTYSFFFDSEDKVQIQYFRVEVNEKGRADCFDRTDEEYMIDKYISKY